MADLYSNTALAGNTRKAVDSTTFGTRDLVFLQIEISQNLETNYTASGSNFYKLIECLQQAVEIYGVGIPSNTDKVTVVVNRQTVPFGDGEEADAGGSVTALETLINAHPDLSGASVYHGKMEGWGIQNDC
jgi:hypothetical protein